jgi:hypothetical protein
MQIKRIGIWSAVRTGAVLGFLLGVLVAGVVGLLGLALGLLDSKSKDLAALSVTARVTAVMLAPLAYAVFAALHGGLIALLYNLTAEFFGGIEIELGESTGTPAVVSPEV